MASPDDISGLPKVESIDITTLFTDDYTESDDIFFDPITKWLEFKKKYQPLGDEIEDQAHIESTLSRTSEENSEQLAQRFARFAMRIIAIFEYAAKREADERAEKMRHLTDLRFSDGGGDGDLPL